MIRPIHDNVILVLEPKPAQTASGIALVHLNKDAPRASRTARVIASGPGYYRESKQRIGDRPYTEATSAFVPNETRPGDRVVIDETAGQNYHFDVSIPRHNVGHEFQELVGEKGQFRIVRESEIHCILESEAAAAE